MTSDICGGTKVHEELHRRFRLKHPLASESGWGSADCWPWTASICQPLTLNSTATNLDFQKDCLATNVELQLVGGGSCIRDVRVGVSEMHLPQMRRTKLPRQSAKCRKCCWHNAFCHTGTRPLQKSTKLDQSEQNLSVNDSMHDPNVPAWSEDWNGVNTCRAYLLSVLRSVLCIRRDGPKKAKSNTGIDEAQPGHGIWTQKIRLKLLRYMLRETCCVKHAALTVLWMQAQHLKQRGSALGPRRMNECSGNDKPALKRSLASGAKSAPKEKLNQFVE